MKIRRRLKVRPYGERTCKEHIAATGGSGLLESSSDAALPTKYGTFRVKAFKDRGGREHLVVYKGNVKSERVPVRVHSQCTTGDCFQSRRCDCGPQLEKALKYVEKNGRGVVVYLAQEGRGIGLFNKINAYVLQERGFDTVDANVRLGFGSDQRDYLEAAEVIKALGVKSVLLMTNNPAKIADLQCHGVKVAGRIPMITRPNRHNKRYLQTKKARMDQLL